MLREERDRVSKKKKKGGREGGQSKKGPDKTMWENLKVETQIFTKEKKRKNWMVKQGNGIGSLERNLGEKKGARQVGDGLRLHFPSVPV